MMKSLGTPITSEERARRLRRVYQLLTRLASAAEAASGNDLGEDVPMAASDPGEDAAMQGKPDG
jgi:hypothetical protein